MVSSLKYPNPQITPNHKEQRVEDFARYLGYKRSTSPGRRPIQLCIIHGTVSDFDKASERQIDVELHCKKSITVTFAQFHHPIDLK